MRHRGISWRPREQRWRVQAPTPGRLGQQREKLCHSFHEALALREQWEQEWYEQRISSVMAEYGLAREDAEVVVEPLGDSPPSQ